MASNFSRNLSLLRQEKGLSQRTVAGDLGISQALLSHYENGIRQPGFAFMCKVCDYYQVSSDFLLGRTPNRDGGGSQVGCGAQMPEGGEDPVAQLAQRDCQILINAMTIIFDLLSKVDEEEAVRAAYHYLGSGIYRMFRHLSNMAPDGKEKLFAVSDLEFAFGAANADMTLDELAYMQSLRQHEAGHKEFPKAGYEALKAAYPEAYQSLMQVIYAGGERVSRVIEAHQKASRTIAD